MIFEDFFDAQSRGEEKFLWFDANCVGTQTRSQGTFTASYTGSGSLNSGVLTITLFKSWNNGGPMTSKTTYVGYKYQ